MDHEIPHKLVRDRISFKGTISLRTKPDNCCSKNYFSKKNLQILGNLIFPESQFNPERFSFVSMKRIICLTILAFASFSLCLGQEAATTKDCDKDVMDSRGTMIPWEKGARETGKYRNLFLEAGYNQTDIDT